MSKFKKGQIVYVSNDKASWLISHYVTFNDDAEFPCMTSSSYTKALKGKASNVWKYCLPVEDYHNMINKPKDKDLVYAWHNPFVKQVGFYDARGNCLFGSIDGSRGGVRYDNYEVIQKEQWPEWAVDAYELLED